MPKAAIPSEELVRQGAEIREARKAAGLSRAELGSRIGVTHVSIGHWESGRTGISPGNLELLKAALQTKALPLEAAKPKAQALALSSPTIDIRMIGLDRAHLTLDADLPYDLVMEIVQRVRQSLQTEATTEEP